MPDFDAPVLNPKLQEMGLSKEQSEAVVVGLLDKLQYAFEGSGLKYDDPCEGYMETLLEDADLSTFWQKENY